MEKEIYEQPAVIGDTLRAFRRRRPTHRIAPARAAVRLRQRWPGCTTVACGTASYAGLVAKYWFERWPACRSTATSPPSSATASRRWCRARPRCSSRSRARPPTRWPRCAMVAQAGLDHARRGQRAGEHAWRARRDGLLRTLAGPEIGVASTKAFTTQLATPRLPGARSRPGARPARRRRERSAAGQALDEVPARMLEALEQDAAIRADRPRPRRGPRRALSSAAARPTRSRSRGR